MKRKMKKTKDNTKLCKDNSNNLRFSIKINLIPQDQKFKLAQKRNNLLKKLRKKNKKRPRFQKRSNQIRARIKFSAICSKLNNFTVNRQNDIFGII